MKRGEQDGSAELNRELPILPLILKLILGVLDGACPQGGVGGDARMDTGLAGVDASDHSVLPAQPRRGAGTPWGSEPNTSQCWVVAASQEPR